MRANGGHYHSDTRCHFALTPNSTPCIPLMGTSHTPHRYRLASVNRAGSSQVNERSPCVGQGSKGAGTWLRGRVVREATRRPVTSAYPSSEAGARGPGNRAHRGACRARPTRVRDPRTTRDMRLHHTTVLYQHLTRQGSGSMTVFGLSPTRDTEEASKALRWREEKDLTPHGRECFTSPGSKNQQASCPSGSSFTARKKVLDTQNENPIRFSQQHRNTKTQAPTLCGSAERPIGSSQSRACSLRTEQRAYLSV